MLSTYEKFISKLIIIVVLSFMLTSCGAVEMSEQAQAVQYAQDQEIVSLFMGTTTQIIKDAMDGVALSRIYYNPEYGSFLFVRAIGDGFGVTGINVAGVNTTEQFLAKIYPGGMRLSTNTASEIMSWLEQNGYQKASPEIVKTVIPSVSSILSATTTELITMANSLTSFMFVILPTPFTPNDFLQDWYPSQDS
jgi:hypothetical protein